MHIHVNWCSVLFTLILDKVTINRITNRLSRQSDGISQIVYLHVYVQLCLALGYTQPTEILTFISNQFCICVIVVEQYVVCVLLLALDKGPLGCCGAFRHRPVLLHS